MKEGKSYDGDRRNTPGSSSTSQVQDSSANMGSPRKAPKGRSKANQDAPPSTRPVLMKAQPKEKPPIDECAGSSASRRLELIADLSSSAPMEESESEHNEDFREGGTHRRPSSPKIKSARSDGGKLQPQLVCFGRFPKPARKYLFYG